MASTIIYRLHFILLSYIFLYCIQFVYFVQHENWAHYKIQPVYVQEEVREGRIGDPARVPVPHRHPLLRQQYHQQVLYIESAAKNLD